MKNTFKSIGAVFAGILVNVILSATTDFILETLEIFTPPGQGFFTPWMVGLALTYRLVYTVAGGYVTAALAPNRPMRHVIILGIIGTVLGCVGVVVAALVITALPCTWLGGKLKTRSEQRKMMV